MFFPISVCGPRQRESSKISLFFFPATAASWNYNQDHEVCNYKTNVSASQHWYVLVNRNEIGRDCRNSLKRGDISLLMIDGLSVMGNMFGHWRKLRVLVCERRSKKKKVVLHTSMGNFSPVAAEAVINPVALCQNILLIILLMSSAILLCWLVSLAKFA